MKRHIVLLLILFILTHPATILAAPEITLKEVEIELNKAKALDITKLWTKLGIDPRLLLKEDEHTYLFGFKPGKETKCVLPKDSWEYKIISSGNATSYNDIDYDEFKILQIKANFWDYQLLIFHRRNDNWIYYDHIDLDMQKYDEPEINFYETRDESLLFSVVTLTGSGTDIVSYHITFYKLIDGKIYPALTLLKKGYMSRWGLMFNRQYEALVWPYFHTAPDNIGLTYYISYYGNTYNYDSKYKNAPEQFLLFSIKKDICCIWNDAKKKYELDGQKSELSEKEIEMMFSGGDEEFHNQYNGELKNIGVNGNDFQREWVEKFFSEATKQPK